MRLGLEIVRLNDDDLARVRALHADVAKVRFLPHIERLAAEGVRHFLLRPVEDNGGPGDLIEMVKECQRLGVTYQVEIANEPNHVDSEWHNRPARWMAVRCPDLYGAFEPAVMLSPGLAVNTEDEGQWVEHLSERRWAGRGFHFYWDGDNGWPMYMARLDAAVRPVVVTEMGDSSEDDWQYKLPRYREALARCAEVGVSDCIIFLAGSDDPQWHKFVPPVEVCEALRGFVAREISTSVESPAPYYSFGPETEITEASVSRTERQQTLIDVTNGWATRMGWPKPLTKREQKQAAIELAGVHKGLEQEWPLDPQ